MAETIRSAHGAESLREALRTATAGTTIELAGGDYGELQLSAPYGDPWSRFAGEVTVRSADPNNPATFSRMYLNGVENLTFDGIAIDYTSPAGLTGRQFFEDNAILVRDSANITIRNSVLEGDVLDAPGSPVDGTPVARSMFIRDSEGVVVENNEIHSWYRGALFLEDKDVVVRGNDVHDIRSDGLNFAAVQDVLIEDNYLHDFAIATDDGVHRDMIQIWTANTDTPSTGITIRDNHLNSGAGVWTQSIFMRNEAVDTGAAGREMFYKNVVIENNVIYNGHSHGITIGEVDGLTITNNTLLHNPASGDNGGVSRPHIRVSEDARNVHVELNIAQAVPTPPGDAAGWKVTDNLLVQNLYPERPNYYGDLFADALAGGGGLDALRALPDSIIQQGGYGSTLTRAAGDTPGGPVVSPENPPENPPEEPAPEPGNEPPPAQGPEPEP
nr:right-handed parallel beta-helix repeat-containing protein [Gemmatimonadota bacterium]